VSDRDTVCLLCGATGLERLFDLGMLPLGSPVPAAQAGLAWRGRLALAICRRCSMVQTESQLPADLLVTETFYTSHRSTSIADHDRAFVDGLLRRGLAGADSLVLDVGCSDGALLDKLRERGFRRLLGIEPSPHADQTYCAEVIVGPFDDAMVQRLSNEQREPDLVIANHVLGGVSRPGEFIANLARVLKPGASLVIEIPYVVDLVRTFRLDGFTHSCNAWFTAASLVYALKSAGLRVEDIEHDEACRSGTLRAFARRAPEAALSPAVTALLAREAEELSAARFAAFRDAVAALRAQILAGLRGLTGTPFYVYGGGLKAATLLNWLGLARRDIVCVVDNDPHKQGRLVPGVDIPIEPVDALWRQQTPIAVLNLALDHRAEVETELAAHLPAGSTIVDALPAWRERRVAAHTVENA
jgi:2-polyprenyl-3-methyl-5-hydroxy-6-metoxy-1,4-benzoquinol methylase